MKSREAQPLRILIVRIGALGDVLHGMPAVAGLRSAMPDAKIGWAIERRWLPLLQGAGGSLPLIDNVHVVTTKDWKLRPLSARTLSEIKKMRQEIRAERYDLCVDLQGSIKSALLSWISGAKVVGSAHPREVIAKLFYDVRFSVTAPNVIGQACQLISRGISEEILPMSARLPVDAEAESWCDKLLGRLQVEKSRLVLLIPTAGWGAKEWGGPRFGQLATRLLQSNLTVLVNQAAGSLNCVAAEIAAASGALVIESTLSQMIALTGRAALVVGGDTGPVHLAAALGRPVVALFGPTDPERNGPYFPDARVQVLRSHDSRNTYKRRTEIEQGLSSLRVEEVLGACLQMLSADSVKESNG